MNPAFRNVKGARCGMNPAFRNVKRALLRDESRVPECQEGALRDTPEARPALARFSAGRQDVGRTSSTGFEVERSPQSGNQSE
jgi:hypothetical protein